MATRFRKLGVTTLGACAGAAVAAWAINSKDSTFKVVFIIMGVIMNIYKLIQKFKSYFYDFLYVSIELI